VKIFLPIRRIKVDVRFYQLPRAARKTQTNAMTEIRNSIKNSIRHYSRCAECNSVCASLLTEQIPPVMREELRARGSIQIFW